MNRAGGEGESPMMWASSALRRNGRLPGVGGGREAIANDAHGVNVVKIREAPVCEKKSPKRGVTWNLGESPPTIVMVQICIRGFMYQGYDIGKNRKDHCTSQ